MVDFHHRAAQIAARYGLMLDFHGTYKPAGLQRTCPNVINFEAVDGLEQLKWANEIDQVTYEVQLPFIRQVAGPMDYTQGAMRNASKSSYRAVNSEPMSQGTRSANWRSTWFSNRRSTCSATVLRTTAASRNASHS